MVPNQALHRIAALLRFLLNLKGDGWAARGERWPLARSMKHPGSRALLLTPASIGAIISIDMWFCPATRKRMKRAHEQY
jgi:hypothetical protein